MKSPLLLLLGIFATIIVSAAPVPQHEARLVAKNFLRLQTGQYPDSIFLADSYFSQQGNRPVYYVYQVYPSDGFVLVSGDDAASPILGYALKGMYVVQNQAEHFAKWIIKYRDEIIYIIANDLPPGDDQTMLWARLRNPQSQPNFNGRSVNPLMNLGWDQGNYYNALCPFNTQFNARTVTGCVATAMAMVMKYWNHPAQGTGFHSYSTQSYGTLSANFAGTDYNWSNMPAQVNAPNNDVATIMYHCGVSVEMTYGTIQQGGSYAYVVSAASPPGAPCSEKAYRDYFGFDPTLQGVLRSNYSEANWINLMKAELDAARVIQYAGIGSGGGHTWICDGYDNNNFFHMNWGWSNQNDGFYNLNALNPSTLGAGGGNGGFNSNQQAVIGIRPATGGGGGGTPVQPNDLRLNSAITGSQVPLDFALPFSIYANVTNVSNQSFTGNLAAALFKPDGFFVDFVQAYSNISIAAGSNTGQVTFSTQGLLATPGNYLVAIVFQPTGGNWQLVGQGNFVNPVSTSIQGPFNYIQLAQSISTSPPTWTVGQPASVTTNIVNAGFFTYIGQYGAALYDLQGNFVTMIGTLNENQGLPPGFSYLSPFLTFSTPQLNVAPGTYILAILEQQQGMSFPYFVGSTNQFANPINVTVVAPPPPPDIYEPNNEPAAAFVFNPTFTNNQAQINSTGANIHIGNDYDYYLINLPSGFQYTITGRAHDAANSANGITYTVDVAFSYNTGSGFNEVFDFQIPAPIVLPNGGPIMFGVAPIFTGNTGTYLLSLSIQRSTPVGIESVEQAGADWHIFPNPTNGQVSLLMGVVEGVSLFQCEVLDAMGKRVHYTTLALGQGQQALLDASQWEAGLYFVTLTNAHGHRSARRLLKQ